MLVRKVGELPTLCHRHGRGRGYRLPATRTCVSPGCTQRAISSAEPDGRMSHCLKHASADMWAAPSRRCVAEDCRRLAYYNVLGQTARYCPQHATANMVLHPRRQCQEPLCHQPATHGRPRAPEHCEVHRRPGDVGVLMKPCASCGLEALVSPDTAHCEDCDDFFHPYRRLKRSEMELKAALTQAGLTFVHDRAVAGGVCGARDRPDFTLDLDFCYVLVENDERQHTSYTCPVTCSCPPGLRDCSCSQARMLDISAALGTPCIWLRFNPDAYRDAQGRPGRVPRTERHSALIAHIQALRQRGPAGLRGFATVSYMYYSGQDNAEERILVPFRSDRLVG